MNFFSLPLAGLHEQDVHHSSADPAPWTPECFLFQYCWTSSVFLVLRFKNVATPSRTPSHTSVVQINEAGHCPLQEQLRWLSPVLHSPQCSVPRISKHGFHMQYIQTTNVSMGSSWYQDLLCTHPRASTSSCRTPFILVISTNILSMLNPFPILDVKTSFLRPHAAVLTHSG